MKDKIIAGLVAISALLAMSASAQVSLIAPDATWKYLDTGVDQGTTWKNVGFADATWKSGTAEFGYGDGDEATVIEFGSPDNRYPTYYFRHTFQVVNNPSTFSAVTLHLTYDDGAVVYLNGNEIYRVGMPGGAITYSTLASVNSDYNPSIVTIPSSALVAGQNTIAVEVHQANTTSADMSFNLELSADTDTSAPTIVSTDPPAGTVITALTFIDVLFGESVTNVEASDLLINGAPATGATMISPREYQFGFAVQPTGTVQVAFASGHGIVDLSPTPNPFGGGSWTYTLDPNAAVARVVISEFLTDNGSGLVDEDGSRSDWIEIYNPGPADVSLGGWGLTDAVATPLKWRFPPMTLGANRYLVVFASEKDRTNAVDRLHTNFKLSKAAGSYLALSDADGFPRSVFASYPAQTTDNSYGRDRVDPNLVGYFTSPTPGKQNTTSGAGYVAEPTFNFESGIYASNLSLTITVPPGSSVRYSTDGSEPTNTTSGTAYTGPIAVTGNLMVKARAFQNGLWPSLVKARTFILLDDTTKNFSSPIPMVVITAPGTIPSSVAPNGVRKRGTVAVIDTFRGRSALTGKVDFQGLAQFETFGQTSEGFQKKPHNIEINDEYGNDTAAGLLGMPSEADWKLRNPFSDKCMINDFLAYELFEQMGNYSVRRRLVEVFVDTGTGTKLSYPADYYGILVLLEKIEVDKNRVNIAELTPANTQEPELSGGYMLKYDKNSTGDLNLTTPGGTGFLGLTPEAGRALKLHEPHVRDVTTNQIWYITNYLAQMEKSLYAATWLTATGTNHYSYYLDPDSFVEAHWITEFPKQIDGYRLSNYMFKDRGGRLKMAPIWDWNLSFGNANYLEGGKSNGWYYTQLGEKDHPWLRRLISGTATATGTTGDPEFKQKIVDRWSVLRTNVMNGTRLVNRIDELATLLSEPAARDFARFPRLYPSVYPGESTPGYVWPNPNGAAGGWTIDYVSPTNYAGIIREMKKWTSGRYVWVDSQFIKAPDLILPAGSVLAGTTLSITATNPIYYTVNGSDPRLPGGAISPSAQLYSGPIALNANSRVVARARLPVGSSWHGTTWSGPSAGTYVVSTPKLVITELMYNPAPPPAGSLVNNEEFEYIEVKNIGGTSLNLQGFSISGGLNYVFPNVTLNAGQSGVIVANSAAFQTRYGIGPLIIGQYTSSTTNHLANEGEQLVLRGPLQEPILDFSYNDNWYPITDGNGFSLVIINENASPTNWNNQVAWRPSGAVNGSPSQNDTAQPTFPNVVINEALTHTDLPQVDAIEILNAGTGPANISFWYLSDDRGTPKKYRFPSGITLAPGATFTVSEAQFNIGPNAFSLSSLGDEVYLFSGDASGNLTGYVQGFDFGPQRNGISFGRYVTSAGEDHFVAQSATSLDAPNSGPLVGPIVINEINYQPVNVSANGGLWDNTEDEFVELYNLTGSPVPLFDPAATTNTWRMRDAVSYQFPTGVTIPAGGYIIVAKVNAGDPTALAAFKARNSIPGNVQVYGPWEGNLDNLGESVELVRPDAPTAGEVPYVLADKVRYSSLPPWPAGAGIGASLQRINSGAYGNDPANWRVTVTSPGGPIPTGTTAEITQQPQNTTVLETRTAVFTIAATGAPPLRYQWHFAGQPIFGAVSSTLVIENAQLSQAGQYGCYVINPGGVVSSVVVNLTVLPSAKFVEQPRDISVKIRPDTGAAPTTNASFNVQVASQNPPVNYQWRFNGTDIAGANSSVLTVVGVTTNSYGAYSCAVADGNGTVFSQSAVLYPLITPIFSVHPIGQTVAPGSLVGLSAQHGGFPGPFTNLWRLGSTPLTNYLTEVGIATYTFRAPATAGVTSLRYNLIVTSRANAQPGVKTVDVNVSTVVDSDGDGIPDSVELALGLNPNSAADGTGDLDGDKMSNVAEVIAGTDPQNPNSYLKVETTASPGVVNLLLRAIAVRTYTIQYTDNLPGGTWQKLADVAAQTVDRDQVITDKTAQPNRFYRIATPAQ